MVYYIVFERGGRIAAASLSKAQGAVRALMLAGFVAWVEGAPAS